MGGVFFLLPFIFLPIVILHLSPFSVRRQTENYYNFQSTFILFAPVNSNERFLHLQKIFIELRLQKVLLNFGACQK